MVENPTRFRGGTGSAFALPPTEDGTSVREMQSERPPSSSADLRRALPYWATLLAACSIGETCADLVSHEFGWGYVRASALFVAAFLLLVALERRVRVPESARYWIAVALMSTTGTALADLFTRTLRLGYAGTSTLLLAAFAGVLFAWGRIRRGDGAGAANVGDPAATRVPLRLEHGVLPPTDAGYWAAIMVASTLGTSLGDFVSDGLGVGFGAGTLLLGTILAVILVAGRFVNGGSTALYWAALVTTSTIGATSGDWLTKEDGLGLAFPVVIACQVAVFGLMAGLVGIVGSRNLPSTGS